MLWNNSCKLPGHGDYDWPRQGGKILLHPWHQIGNFRVGAHVMRDFRVVTREPCFMDPQPVDVFFLFRISQRLYQLFQEAISVNVKRTWWRHQMETFSALLAICVGNSPVPGELLTQRPVTRSFGVFFDLHPNKRLSKQWWCWWFETLSCPLWRHCNDIKSYTVSKIFVCG